MMRCQTCSSSVEGVATMCIECRADAASHDTTIFALMKSRDHWRTRAHKAERVTDEQCDEIESLRLIIASQQREIDSLIEAAEYLKEKLKGAA